MGEEEQPTPERKDLSQELEAAEQDKNDPPEPEPKPKRKARKSKSKKEKEGQQQGQEDQEDVKPKGKNARARKIIRMMERMVKWRPRSQWPRRKGKAVEPPRPR